MGKNEKATDHILLMNVLKQSKPSEVREKVKKLDQSRTFHALVKCQIMRSDKSGMIHKDFKVNMSLIM